MLDHSLYSSIRPKMKCKLKMNNVPENGEWRRSLLRLCYINSECNIWIHNNLVSLLPFCFSCLNLHTKKMRTRMGFRMEMRMRLITAFRICSSLETSPPPTSPPGYFCSSLFCLFYTLCWWIENGNVVLVL